MALKLYGNLCHFVIEKHSIVLHLFLIMEIVQIQAIQMNVGSKKTHFIAISAKLVFLEVNHLYIGNYMVFKLEVERAGAQLTILNLMASLAWLSSPISGKFCLSSSLKTIPARSTSNSSKFPNL